jgi:hypothetical protein
MRLERLQRFVREGAVKIRDELVHDGSPRCVLNAISSPTHGVRRIRPPNFSRFVANSFAAFIDAEPDATQVPSEVLWTTCLLTVSIWRNHLLLLIPT